MMLGGLEDARRRWPDADRVAVVGGPPADREGDRRTSE